MVDLSHRIAALHFGVDDDAMNLTFNLKTGTLERPADAYSPLVGTVAQQPLIIGNMQIGFYSAYYTDVTPITMIPENGEKKHSL